MSFYYTYWLLSFYTRVLSSDCYTRHMGFEELLDFLMENFE